MDLVLSHVKETVIAYLVPVFTRSTKCGFSAPEVKADNRPFLGSTIIVLFETLSIKLNLPPVKSTP